LWVFKHPLAMQNYKSFVTADRRDQHLLAVVQRSQDARSLRLTHQHCNDR